MFNSLYAFARRLTVLPSHVNNCKYIRYAETGRINWINILAKIDPQNKDRWTQLWTPRGKGLILKSIKTDFKFVSPMPSRDCDN